MTQVETFPAKRLLTPVQYDEQHFFPAEYNMNLYRGCNHGCIYCDTRSECYRIDRFEDIRVKENCVSMLETELRAKKKAGIVMMGAATDPYNALEEELSITRQALALFRRYQFGVGIPTKSALIARDADVLVDIAKVAPAYVCFSITAAEDALARRIEPHAPASSERFAAMETLARAGVFTGLWLNPVLPFLTDSEQNLRSLLQSTAQSGGKFAICHFGMTLRTGNREYFFNALDQEPHFAGMKQLYADAFGLSYYCPSPHAERLLAFFHEECEKLGLLCRFPTISHALRARCPQQRTLF